MIPDRGAQRTRPVKDGARYTGWRAVLGVIAALPLLLGATNGTLNVSWQSNAEADLASYVLQYGTQSGVYPARVTLSNTTTSHTLVGLDTALTYYFALTAKDFAGNESALSLETAAQPNIVVGALPVVSEVEDAASGTPFLMQCNARTVRVTGANFQNGASVGFTDSSISVSSATWVSTSLLTAVVLAPATASLGPQTVRVTNPDGGSGSRSGALSVEVVKSPDFSRNGKVGAEDFNRLAIAFGSTSSSPAYDAAADLDGDGIVNGDDLTRFTPFLGLAVTFCP